MPGSAPFAFSVKSTGSIPVTISVAANAPFSAKFHDMLGAVAPFVLTQGQTHDFAAGISWDELSTGNLGEHVSVTYTISAAG